MEKMGPTTSAMDRRFEADALATALLGLHLESTPSPKEARRRSILTRTIEQDVIPQLLRLHRGSEAAAAPRRGITEQQVAHLVDLTLRQPGREPLAFVMMLHEDGIAAETLYLDLLGPAARMLGQFWVDDVCDFTQVTVGVIHLQHAMRALGPAFLGDDLLDRDEHAQRRALLVPMPGEHHTFGLAMVFDFFRRAGWNAWTGPIASTEQLGRMVGGEWVDLVGFSLGCGEVMEAARQEIRAVRLASRNPALAVMVGGPACLADPGLADAVGADGSAQDGLQAVSAANALVESHSARTQG